jgi:hypothetical protein
MICKTNDSFTNLLSYVMVASTAGSVEGNSPDAIATLDRSDPAGPHRTQQVERIRSLLSAYTDDVIVWTYRKQLDPDIRRDGAWGKGAVSLVHGLRTSGFFLNRKHT